MGLIKIAAATSDIGPVHRLLRSNKPKHFLETSNAAKQFWRQPDFAPELFDELLVADPEVMRDRRDALQMRLADKLANGPRDAPVPAHLRVACGQPLPEHLLENLKLGLRARRRQESLSPLPDARPPERIQLDHLPAEFTRGQT